MPSYTAVGGRERLGAAGLSAVLLNRPGRYSRRGLFQDLEKAGFDYVISVEHPRERCDVEDLSGRFPFVRFILLKEDTNPGGQINLAASELSEPLFFVLWNDMRVLSGQAALTAERLFLGAEERRKAGAAASPVRRLCTVPVIQNSRFETIPSLAAPAVFRNTVKTLSFPPRREGHRSLYPFDGVGIYDRERFIRLGGFDRTLDNAYWQLMDFGFRAHLWGEEIVSTQHVKIAYEGDTPVEDSTVGESYRRFYLKNLAPVFRGGAASLPILRFPGYLIRSGGDPLAAWEDFSESRRWVKTNRYRWTADARGIAESWEDAGETAGS
ncbi:MAG: hypothetical protein LBQ55_10390 [Treponema sp.]|jgi:hypothetical protein|nr:hypothetical protein [Treponema sp.]